MRVPVTAILVALLVVAGPVEAPAAQGAPVIPNESLVAGELLEVAVIDSATIQVRPPQKLYRMRIRVDSVHKMPSKASFLTAKPGETLEVYSKEAVQLTLVGKTVRGRVVFRGDERGGLYWISSVGEAP